MEEDNDQSIVSLVNGEKLSVCGTAKQVATRLNPAGHVGGGLSALDGTEGEVLLVNARHVVAILPE